MDIKEKIERIVSDILSDRYGCKITIHFEPKETIQEGNQ